MSPELAAKVKQRLADAEFTGFPVTAQEEILRRDGVQVDDEFRAMLQHLKGDPTPGQAALAGGAQAAGEFATTHPFQSAAVLANFHPAVSMLGGAGLGVLGGIADQALGFNPQGVKEAARSIPSTLGTAIAGKFMPVTGPLMRGLGMGVGGVAGEGIAQGTGMVPTSTAMLAASGLLPPTLGAAEGTFLGSVRAGARMAPGANPAMHEEAFTRAQAYPASLAPPVPAKDLYGAIARESGDVMVPTPNLAATRTRYWQQELELAKYSPESLSPEIAAASGSTTLQKLVASQPELTEMADAQRTVVMESSLRVQKAEAKLDGLINSPRAKAFSQSYQDDVSFARQELDIAEDKFARAQTDHAGLLKDYQSAVVDTGALLSGLDTPFDTLQVMLQRQNERYAQYVIGGGKKFGAVKDIIKAIKTDMDNVILNAGIGQGAMQANILNTKLKQANETFRKELAVDYLKEVANTTQSDMRGVTGVNAQTLASKIKRTAADPDGPLAGLSSEEMKNVDSFYSELSKKFSPESNLMMGMIWTGVGSGLTGVAMGSSLGAMGFAGGAVAGLAFSNSLAQIALSSPKWRHIFISLLEAGKGKIAQGTLDSVVQLAAQETGRDAAREVEVSVQPPARGSLFMNAQQPTGAPNLLGMFGQMAGGGFNPPPGF